MENILVVFTPEHQGYASLKHAMNIAKGCNVSRLRLLYVIPSAKIMIPIPMPPQGMFSPVPMCDSPVCKELTDIASIRLSEFENMCSKADIACTSDTVLGKRGYLTAEMAALSRFMVCEKRPEKQPFDTRYRDISLAAISRSSGVPILAVPQEYEDIKVIQTIYNGSLKSSLLLGFSMRLAQIFGIILRILLIDGRECKAEDLQGKVNTILSDFLPDSESEVETIGKAKRILDQFSKAKDTITTISPGWYMNYMYFRLSRNETVHAFKGPVAIVP